MRINKQEKKQNKYNQAGPKKEIPKLENNKLKASPVK